MSRLTRPVGFSLVVSAFAPALSAVPASCAGDFTSLSGFLAYAGAEILREAAAKRAAPTLNTCSGQRLTQQLAGS